MRTNCFVSPQRSKWSVASGTRAVALRLAQTIAAVLLVAVGATPFNLSAAPANVPATGQQRCHDGNGGEVACGASGQDGEHRSGVAWPNPRFVDHGDGTITDRLTGLMWLRNANLFGPGSRMEWDDALFNLGRMNAGAVINFGYNDWRLPNVNELESMLNFGATSPAAWLNGRGFANVQDSPWYYWSSTGDVATGGSLAWAVRFSDGKVFRLPISGTANGRNHFWAVRAGVSVGPDARFPANVPKTGQNVSYGNGDDGGLRAGVTWPSPRFTDNGDGTITDNLTALMWLKDASCMTNHYPGFDTDWARGDGAVDWPSALEFVAGIGARRFPACGGPHTDWRLPNVREFRSLVDHGRTAPALPTNHPFTGGAGPTTFWSSSSSASQPDSAWRVDLWTGATDAVLKLGGLANYYFGVLPVRGSSAVVDPGEVPVPDNPPGTEKALMILLPLLLEE